MSNKIAVTIQNDGKGRWQSFEASLSLWQVDSIGYGATEAEAKQQLVDKINKVVKEINEAIHGIS